MNEGYTDWAVLTGGACSGKSTLANYFLADGQEVIPESANQYVEFGNSKGMSPNKLQSYGTGGPIPHLDLQMENRRDPEQPILLDRSLGDSLAFLDYFGGDVPDELIEEASDRYDVVFHLDRVVDHEPHKTRTDDFELSRKIDQHLGEFYEEKLGYETIKIPDLDLEQRASMVAEYSELKEPDLEFNLPKSI
jgi:predicted ATPase